MAEKQLFERPSDREASFFGESSDRRRSCFIAEIKSSVGFRGGIEDLNALWNFICRFTASPVVILLWDLRDSSFTASAQSPQIHRPSYLSRTRLMYAGVHSSVNPQHSHFTDSTSITWLLCCVTGAVCSMPDITFVIVVTFAAIVVFFNQALFQIQSLQKFRSIETRSATYFVSIWIWN